jgi:hypothetical protein
MKFKFFLFFAIFSSYCFSESIYDCFKGQEWKFIEFMLVKKVDRECNSYAKKAKQWGLTFLAFWVTQKISPLIFLGSPTAVQQKYKILFEKSPDDPDKKIRDEYFSLGFALALKGLTIVVTDIVATILAYRNYNYWYRSATEYERCLELIQKWPEYKQFSPKELQGSFEGLYQKYLKQRLTDEEVYDTIEAIKEMLKQKLSVIIHLA